MRLDGKRVVVTGASGSIGQAIALAMAKEGAQTVISYRSDRDGAIETVKQMGSGHALFADFAQTNGAQQFMDEALDYLGGIDLLVNNAGIVDRSDFLSLEASTFQEVLLVNLIAPQQLMQLAARQMIESGNGGAVINISSIGATRSAHNRTAYASSKAGLEAMTRCAAIELGPYGIRVNGIAPGVTNSGLAAESARKEPGWLGKRTERIALGRIGEPKDYVGAALYLASSDSTWVTGQTLVVDGGHSLLM